jgi:hypothetical protein
MEAVVGSEMPFAKACEPMKVLAGLEVSAKAIERAAEAIGTEIARRDDREIARAKQLLLPAVSQQDIPIMYVLLDGVQIPAVAAATEGRLGRADRQRARTRGGTGSGGSLGGPIPANIYMAMDHPLPDSLLWAQLATSDCADVVVALTKVTH